jgi:hypothetical protein
MPPESPLEARLARAERVITELAREIADIRAAIGAQALGEPPRESASERIHQSRSATPRRRNDIGELDFERLLGRYGMLGIAVLAAIAAVGTFLSWAISHGYLALGPAARVVLGLVFAGVVGAAGIRLRRTEKSFGSSLVGLALTIVLVCAYAAGPGFHLVPSALAFAGSAAVAWGLALFARSQDDEPLWCVAFGGAAVAPFATSDQSGNLFGLLAYAFVLLTAACFGVGHRRWPVAWRIFYLCSTLLVLATTFMATSAAMWGVVATMALPLVVGAAGVLPFAPDSRKRAVLRWLAILLILSTGALIAGSWVATAAMVLAGVLLAAIALWCLLIDRLRGVEQSSLFARNDGRVATLDWIDCAVIPLVLSLRIASLTTPGQSTATMYAIVAAIALIATWRHPVGSQRDAAAFATMALLAGVLNELSPDVPLTRVSAFLALALVAFLLHRVRPSITFVATGLATLFFAASLSVSALVNRPVYSEPPFATRASLTAAIVTVALVLLARSWHSVYRSTCAAMGARARRTYADNLIRLLRWLAAAPWMWAFIWGLIELSMAYSSSTSTLLLVLYFASTAVMSVAVGRMRRSAILRQLGLALAVTAAATSVYGATNYFDSGIRIVAYLVTSAFLLGIAFWYRRPGSEVVSA